MANELSKYVFNQWFLNSGAVNNAGTITVYDANTTDLSTIYSDKAGTALANPFTLAASGRMSTGDLFLPPGTYDTVIKDSAGATIDTVEDVDGPTQVGVLTEGSVIFADSNGDITQDNANLFFDDTNNRLGLGEVSPGTQLDMASTAPYLTLHNTTEEDGAGGRESRLIFEGEQSGGEQSTLGIIEFSHDGAADDEKGEFNLYLNDGDDGDLPIILIKGESTGKITLGGGGFTGTEIEMWSESPNLTLYNTTDEDGEGGREGVLEWQGDTSGSVLHTLAKIQASHDGAGADQKGDIIFYTNDGSDGTTPTESGRFDSAQEFTLAASLRLPVLGGIPGTASNGSCWMEADGLHIYYNGAEKLVAGV